MIHNRINGMYEDTWGWTWDDVGMHQTCMVAHQKYPKAHKSPVLFRNSGFGFVNIISMCTSIGRPSKTPRSKAQIDCLSHGSNSHSEGLGTWYLKSAEGAAHDGHGLSRAEAQVHIVQGGW